MEKKHPRNLSNKQQKKHLLYIKRSLKEVFSKSLARALQNQQTNQADRIFQENMLNNKQQKECLREVVGLFFLLAHQQVLKVLQTHQHLQWVNLVLESKQTISRAMNVEEFEIKQRSLASVKRARQKEKKLKKDDIKKEFKKVIRDVNIPSKITIQELSNRMAEQSSGIIKFLLNMGVQATINHTIDKDTAEYIVKEFGHNPVLEKIPVVNLEGNKKLEQKDLKPRPPIVTVMGHVDHG